MEDNKAIFASGDVKDFDQQNENLKPKKVFQKTVHESPKDDEDDFHVVTETSTQHWSKQSAVKIGSEYNFNYSTGHSFRSTISVSTTYNNINIGFVPIDEESLPQLVTEYEKYEPENNYESSSSCSSESLWDTESSPEEERGRSNIPKHKMLFDGKTGPAFDIEYYDLYEVEENSESATKNSSSVQKLMSRISRIFSSHGKPNKVSPETSNEDEEPGSNPKKKSFCRIM